MKTRKAVFVRSLQQTEHSSLSGANCGYFTISLLALAEAIFQPPALLNAGNGNNIEIEALAWIVFRQEGDLTAEAPILAGVEFRLDEH